jgi:hypothetical protein
MVNSLNIFSNLTKIALSHQLLTLFLNLTNRGLVFLNSSDLSDSSDVEIIALKELIKD